MQKNGKKFGELMLHFMFILDEACIMKDVGINIITIGADDRKNHENILADR